MDKNADLKNQLEYDVQKALELVKEYNNLLKGTIVGQILTLHKYKERNPKGITEAKDWFKRANGRLYCDICTFDFEERYGEIGKEFIEGHHTIAVADL